MAIIELLDRDIQARKVDVKKKPEEKAKPAQESKLEDTSKEIKSKK